MANWADDDDDATINGTHDLTGDAPPRLPGMPLQPPELVTLTSTEILRAHVWGATVEANVVGTNHRGYHAPGRYRVGYAGEVGWLRLCQRHGIRCDYLVRTEGTSVHTEFTVYYRGRPRPLDVKTAGRKEWIQFLCPVAAAPEPGVLYVGARLQVHGDDWRYHAALDVAVFGWLWGTDVRALPVATFGDWDHPAHHCLLTDLHPIDRLLAQLDRGGIVLQGRARDLA